MRALAIIFLIAFVVPPVLVWAQVQNLPEVPVLTALYRIARWLWTILLIVAVIAIIIGAYYFVTAGGNPEQITKARMIVLYAVIGVIVAGLAWGLVSLARRIVLS